MDNLELATQIAVLPDELRGHGHIKARAIRESVEKWKAMLEHYIAGHRSYTETTIVKLIDAAVTESQVS